MKAKLKNTKRLRQLLIFSIAICFIFFIGLFASQYIRYKRIQDQLSIAYATNYNQSSNAYELFTTFSQAESLFRLYTVDFSTDVLENYKSKLDIIRVYIDSIGALDMENNPLKDGNKDLELYRTSALEFANIKRDVDKLVLFANDSLQILVGSTNNIKVPKRNTIGNLDSIVRQTLRDTTQNSTPDTLFKRRQGLLKRIFNSKDDTLINSNSLEILTERQTDRIHKTLQNIITTNEKVYSNNLKDLQSKFNKMQKKERELVLTNFNLLSNIKLTIDKIKELEVEHLRKSEEKDFKEYRKSFNVFGQQIIIALLVMLLMIFFIAYYQRKTASFERKLLLEKNYAAKIAEEKTDILANISHEIRTPVTSLKGIIEILKNNNTNKLVDPQIVQTVDNDINKINNTIDDILNLSKIEANSIDIKFEYLSPSKLIDEVVALHDYYAKSKGLSYVLKNNIDPNLQIFNNSFRIKQVVSNLITNALKYTSDGSVTVHAYIKEGNERPHLIVEVQDTGIGIEEDKQDQIFRKYYIAENKNRTGSFGLGLYISKIFSSQINGDIRFASKFGTGSIFTFDLPLDKAHIVHRQPDAPHTMKEIPSNTRIVVVDDNQINLLFTKQLFDNKIDAHFLTNSEEAWLFIQNNDVDVVITDIIMPNMTGWQLLERIKSNNRLAHIKVIACTAENSLVIDKTHKTSFDGSLSKPFTESELVGLLLNR